MKIKKRDILSILVLSIVTATFFSLVLRNMFIAPIGMLITNTKEGNFKPNKYLLERDINIVLKKYEWVYYIKKMDGRIIVNFTSFELNNQNYKYQMADMHVLDKNISNSLFFKMAQAGMEECDRIIKKQETKNNHLVNYTLCSYKGENFVHYDIPSKKIMITYYPYTEDKKNKQVLQEFLDGIIIKD